jgi:hypothetical protein
MTNRVLRWLSAIALVMLTLVVVWIVSTPPQSGPQFVPVPPPIHLSFVQRAAITITILPYTTAAVCLLSGLITLVVSSQRKQWGWFAGAVICFAVYLYGSMLPVNYSAEGWISTWIRPFLGAHAVEVLNTGLFFLYTFVLVVAPMAILALVYAWPQRKPAPAASELDGARLR